MFTQLSERLNETLKKLRGQGRISEDNIKDSMREIRVSLLEADVALPVVKQFIEEVQQKAVGQTVMQSLNPGQQIIKIVHDEIVHVMGDYNESLQLDVQKPAVILMAGLQGSGKTTSSAKLARYLTEREHKKILMVSTDVYRPAAIQQLEKLGADLKLEVFPSNVLQKPTAIASDALQHAKKQFFDVLIVDTAGRLHIDHEMMQEIQELHQTVHPAETLFVVDSMTGQDAAVTAKAFNDALPLTGVILTKTDGDAKGGAALSIRYITGKPIKFIGSGEKTDALEPFHPERIASRIFGHGDVLTLVEEVERKIDKKQSEKLAKKIQKGQGFDFEDFRDQLLQMNNLGGMSGILAKLPGMSALPNMVKQKLGDKTFNQMIVIINSMTIKERRFPKLLGLGSRKKRIAAGSGTSIQDVNKLIKQHTQMQKMMKKFSRPGAMKNMMRAMQGQGMLPDDLMKQ